MRKIVNIIIKNEEPTYQSTSSNDIIILKTCIYFGYLTNIELEVRTLKYTYGFLLVSLHFFHHPPPHSLYLSFTPTFNKHT